MEEARTKALNILFDAALIGFISTAVIIGIVFYTSKKAHITELAVMLGPIITYVAGRILCFKEYK